MDIKGNTFNRFLLLWIGELVSTIGSGLTAFGFGVYIYEQTGRASDMALITLIGFLPMVLLSPIAGVFADRYDRRLLMILGDSLSVVGLIYIWICLLDGEATLGQICLGVGMSAVFASLIEPAYRATVTDLLSEDQYAKASGFVQIAGASKFLISPALAGILLKIADIRLLVLMDILTFFVTVSSTLVVRKNIAKLGAKKEGKKEAKRKRTFMEEMKEGWQAITQKRGVIVLVWMSSALTFFMGFLQTLAAPMILAFESSFVAGFMETFMAAGMLVSSVVIGIFSIKGGYHKVLSVALFGSGLFMVLFGLKENTLLISLAGFLFFTTLPFANTSLDYLVRTNIDDAVQGRVWGLISVISQSGYIASYALSGILADYIFTPLLLEDGELANSVGRIVGIGSGRGIGLLISIAGLLLALLAIIIYHAKSVQILEKRGEPCI